jgi:hypothetical protein
LEIRGNFCFDRTDIVFRIVRDGSPHGCGTMMLLNAAGEQLALVTAREWDVPMTPEDAREVLVELLGFQGITDAAHPGTWHDRGGIQVVSVDRTVQGQSERTESWYLPHGLYEVVSRGQPLAQFEQVVADLLVATARAEAAGG